MEKTFLAFQKRLRDVWGAGLRSVASADFRELRGEIGANDPTMGDRWVAIGDALANGSYETLVIC